MTRILALAALALAPAIASAHGAYPVSSLSCAQAQAQVAAHNMYYKGSFDGLLPIYPVYSQPVSCNNGSVVGRLNYIFEATADNAQCFLGYRCGRM
jgi:hypothetical protein